MTTISIPLGILQRISEFLAELPEDQLVDLAAGRARLAYVREGSTDPEPRKKAPARQKAAPDPPQDVAELVEELSTMSSRDDAGKRVADMRKPALVAIARALSVPKVSDLTVPALKAAIVEATVGRRLDSIAIRGFEGDRP